MGLIIICQLIQNDRMGFSLFFLLKIKHEFLYLCFLGGLSIHNYQVRQILHIPVIKYITKVPTCMENYQAYDPLRWPPDLKLAELHMKCVCPGKDNNQGIQCPCCGRMQKIQTKKWYSRDILKDFKNYGGGIPGYFQLLKYCCFSLVMLGFIIALYHIYILEFTCPLIIRRYQGQRQALFANACQEFLIFKFCDTKIIIDTLEFYNENFKSTILFALQMFSFLFLVGFTIGMRLWLQFVNNTKINKYSKVFSYFSLMVKNIPKYYSIEDVKKQLHELVEGIEISQAFFVYQISELESLFKKIFDLHFEIQYIKQSIASERGETIEHLNQLIAEYKIMYNTLNQEKKKIGVNNGRAIVVFNNFQNRRAAYKALKVNQCSKLWFHTMKILGYNTMKLHFFADKISEPQQIYWRYIGESSMNKTYVRIKTSLVGFGFIVVAFLLLYFPIVFIDVQSIKNHSTLTTVLSIFISLLLQILTIIYRLIILRIVPSRNPSSREAESYFIVLTTVVFHFFFYIVAPATYFQVGQKIPINIKLKQLFAAVFIFLIMAIVIALIDMRYRLYNSRRKKTLLNWKVWGKLCQMRLHQQIRWPSFPIQFKLMVVLNIWSFNAFYIFEIPYLAYLFSFIIVVIYWIDKKNIYKHYKMQVYQSIDIQLSVQKAYIILFLITVCCGYAVCATYTWQYYFIGGVFVLSIIINSALSYQINHKDDEKKRTMTLANTVNKYSQQLKSLNRDGYSNLLSVELRENLITREKASTVSLGSVQFQYGYKQIYETYLNQFRSKHITNLLEETFKQYSDPKYNAEEEIIQIRRTTQIPKINELRHVSRRIQQVVDIELNISQDQKEKNEKKQGQNTPVDNIYHSKQVEQSIDSSSVAN